MTLRAPARTALSIAAFAAMIASAVLYAGPLDPPPGPVAPTGKTLTQIEPRIAINATNTPGDADSLFRITQPGSYYLTGNTPFVLNQHAIEIAASNVTIDLMGFRIQGSNIGAFDGIIDDTTVTTHSNIRITNGSIAGFSRNGINLSDTGNNHRIDNIIVTSNAEIGIRVGENASIDSCSASNNGSTGIACFGAGAIVRNCGAYFNGGSGIILTSNGSITGCTANANVSTGFRTGNGATLADCSARGNGFDGFDVGQGTMISSCSAYSNGAEGIDASINCVVSNCSVAFSGSHGVLLSSGTVSGCAAYANAGDGIRVASDTIVVNNSCDNSGNGGSGAGIHATGSDNRIEGNNCTDGDRGIEVGLAGNFIVRNTCGNNTIGWVIAANNVVGPILDRRAPGSAAINGFSAPDSTGSTHPNANFSY